MSPESQKMDNTSSLHRLAELFQKAFRGRKVQPDILEVESWALIVGEVMSARWRHYHVPEHVFGLARGTRDPIEILAILFHDLVYIQVDRRVHPKLQKFLYDLNPDDHHELTLSHSLDRDHSVLPTVLSVFGFKPGENLSLSNGLNEFLSAVTAARTLRAYLSTWELIQVIGCIEATIPFRGGLGESEAVPLALKNRYQKLNQDLDLQLSAPEIDQAVSRSVRVSNLDVRGFWHKDASHFLYDSWNLILEGNPVFKNPYYTVGQYLTALEKVFSFYNHLDPVSIPRCFLGEPTPKEMARYCDDTRRNLEVGKVYLQTKILATHILLSVARLTGGDAAMILFMGEVNTTQDSPSRIEQHLDTQLSEGPTEWVDSEVLRILTVGRAASSPFDFKHSPLAAYLYSRMSPEDFKTAAANERLQGRNKIDDFEFLSRLPSELILAVLNAIGQVATTRAQGIQNLKEKIQALHRKSRLQVAS